MGDEEDGGARLAPVVEDVFEYALAAAGVEAGGGLVQNEHLGAHGDAAAYSQYLQPLPAAELNDLTYDRYVQDCADRRASACSVFQMTNSGFHAEITLDAPNLVFFSVPYDDGFTATVNGKETDILRVDEGLMAVLCPAGESTLDFVYQPDGIRLGKPVTLLSLVVFVSYTSYFAWDDRKKRKP